MAKLILSIFIVTAALTVSVLGFQLYQGANMTQEAFVLSQEVQKLKLEKELAEVERQTQQDAITYRLKAAQLKSKERLVNSGMVAKSRELGAATLYLWPVLSVLAVAIGAGLFAYSRRQTTIQEVEKARHSELIQTGEAAARAVEKAMPNLVRAAIAAIPKQAAIVDQGACDIQPEPEALRAFSGNVHFSQAQLDEDYDPESIMMGRNVETGGLCQIPLDELQSLTVNGLQKQGKSILLLSLVHHALYRTHVKRQPITLILVDIHAGYKDSLLTRVELMCPKIGTLFDRTFQGEDQIENELPAFLDELITTGKAARDGGLSRETLIVFDEYSETVTALAAGREIEAKVKRLFNYRKAGIYLALAMFEAGKNNQSAKGLNVSKMSVSKALFHTAKDEGSRFLPGGSEAASLDKGEYLLLLPGMAEPERIKAAIFAPMDFQPFSKYVNDAAPELAGDVEPEPGTDDQAITPEAVRSYLEQEGLSQNALAKSAGISKSDLSRWMNDKSLSDEKAGGIVAALQSVIAPAESANVIDLKHYRKA